MQGYVYGYSYFQSLHFVILIFFLMYRHIYVADLFGHNVHVLERKEDNALVSVKVNNSKFQQYESTSSALVIEHLILLLLY